MGIFISTMCRCGDNQQIADPESESDNQFVPHVNRHTGELCPGVPQTPSPSLCLSKSHGDLAAERDSLQNEVERLRVKLNESQRTEQKLRSVLKSVNRICENRGKERDLIKPVFEAAVRLVKVGENGPAPDAHVQYHVDHELQWDETLDEVIEAVETFRARLKEAK